MPETNENTTGSMQEHFMRAADALADQKKLEVTQKYEGLKKSYE